MSGLPSGTAPFPWYAEELQRYDSDRFAVCLCAPAERRGVLLALHAVNLEIARTRELVISPIAGQIRLQWWRDTLEALCRGDAVAATVHPALAVLAPAVARWGLGYGGWERLLEAREQDIDEAPPPTLEAMAAYAEATTAPLVLYSLQCLEGLTPGAAAAAAHVGTAWGLVGLMRAIPFHARYCRIHLPADLMAEAGVTTQSLLDGVPDSRGLAVVLERVATRAKAHMASARGLFCEVPRAAVPGLLLAGLAERYLRRMEQSGWGARTGWPLFASALAEPLPWRLTGLLWQLCRGRY